MKIEATTRLLAMTISQGDNFPDVKKNIKMLMGLPGSAFKKVGTVGGLTVLERTKNLACWYVLVEGDPDLSKETLKKAGVKDVEGLMTVMQFPKVDEVFSVWLAPTQRGKGTGKALYTFARSKAKCLESSEELGSMSLALWLSLYKTNPKIALVIDQKKVKRENIQVKNLSIVWTNKGQAVDITKDALPKFKFVWK